MTAEHEPTEATHAAARARYGDEAVDAALAREAACQHEHLSLHGPFAQGSEAARRPYFCLDCGAYVAKEST